MNKWSQVFSLEQNSAYTRVLIVTRDGRVRGAAFERHRVTTPQPGWVELDPAELWYKAKKVLAAGLDIHRSFPEEIAAVGITAEPSTVLVWNRETGEPYYNAITQADTRADALFAHWQADGIEETIRSKSGLSLSPRLPASKLRWLLDNVPNLRADAERGLAIGGGIDTWLLWRVAGAHATDYTSAAYTLLFNIHTLDWDQELLDLFDIPRAMLPTLHPSSDSRLFGQTTERTPFNGAVPVAADLCAPQAAALGLGCWERGDGALIQSPADTLILNTGREMVRVTGEAWATLAFAAERHAHSFLLRAELKEQSLPETLRRVAEGAHIPPRALAVDGDRAQDNGWMQQQANALGIPIIRPRYVETTALGAAYAAGLAVGFWKDMEEVRTLWMAERVFVPGESSEGRAFGS